MGSQPPCETWAEKLALRQEDLSLADRTALAAHLQTCRACSAALEDYRFLDTRLRALPPPVLKPVPRLAFPMGGEEKENENIREQIKITGRLLFPGWNALPVTLIARLILVALLLFGMQSASSSGSKSPERLLFTYGGYSIYHGYSSYVDAVAWSPDGQYIASGGWDGTIQVWNAHTGA